MKPRVVVAHAPFGPHGGGELLAAWFLQALKDDYALTLACADPVDWRAVDARFGTSLAGTDIAVETWPGAWRGLLRCWPGEGDRLRRALQERVLARLARKGTADLWIGTCNESGLPEAGLQYVHFPTGDPADGMDLRPHQRLPGARAGYRWLCAALTPGGLVDFREHVTLVNSRFTAGHWERAYGLSCRVVYPPVPPPGTGLPWAERVDRVVCLGRLLPGKGIGRVVRIVAAARERGAVLTLTFAGTWHCGSKERRRLEAMLGRHEWVTLCEAPSREAVAALAGSSRYGLHGMLDEPFGIAVAELQEAGLVTLAPSRGGPAEIIGDERLLYRDEADAVEKLLAAWQNPALRDELRAGAAARTGRFSPEVFMRAVRAEVATALAAQSARKSAAARKA